VSDEHPAADPTVNRVNGTDFEIGDDCIRCGEAPPVDRLGYCGHCHWAALAEVEEGVSRLGDSLARWADFRDWELTSR